MGKRSLRDSRALVTGASEGIGRHLALELARAGAHVAVVARRRPELETLAIEIGQLGCQTLVLPGDVTDANARLQALAAIDAAWGRLDVLVNNAGVSAHGRFADATPERLRTVMEVNFFAAAELMRAALPMLRVGRQPVVVNVGSILAHRGIPHNSEYVASKFALRGLSEAIRPEFQRLGIDVLVVNPGTTDTDMFDHLVDKQGDIPWKQKRGVPPEVVAQNTVRAISRGRHETIPSLPGKALVWLNRLAPRLVDRLMARYG